MSLLIDSINLKNYIIASDIIQKHHNPLMTLSQSYTTPLTTPLPFPGALRLPPPMNLAKHSPESCAQHA